jgi:flagellar protein FlaJ
LLAAITVFIIGYFYPIQLAASRRAKIETNLPFVVAHMGAIASSGIPPSAVFKLLSKFKEYDVLAEEMEKIVTNIEVFGLDPVTAMKEVAKRTPSEKFKQILLGFASTIESGGSLKVYLKNMSEQTLFHWRMKREKYLQQLSTYAEFYTGILIAAPLFIISLFSIMNMIEPNLGGVGILQLMRLSIYLLIPILNIAFIFFLSATQVEI